MRRSWFPSIVPSGSDLNFYIVINDYGNIAEHWAEDASEGIAREISRRADLARHELPSSIEAFVDSHLGPDRQLTLRLA